MSISVAHNHFHRLLGWQTLGTEFIYFRNLLAVAVKPGGFWRWPAKVFHLDMGSPIFNQIEIRLECWMHLHQAPLRLFKNNPTLHGRQNQTDDQGSGTYPVTSLDTFKAFIAKRFCTAPSRWSSRPGARLGNWDPVTTGSIDFNLGMIPFFVVIASHSVDAPIARNTSLFFVEKERCWWNPQS